MISEADKERMQKLLAIACDETANPVVRAAAMKAWEQMVLDNPPETTQPSPEIDFKEENAE